MKSSKLCILFFSVTMIGCATKKDEFSASHLEVTGVRWPVDNSTREHDAEQICDAVVVPVSPAQLERAISMLASASFVRVSVPRAEKLIGHTFSARKAMMKKADYHFNRSEFFAEQLQRHPDDISSRKAIVEHREMASRLRSQSNHLTPYLIRAIGLRGCGTGGFYAYRQNNEIWISFAGLGSGFAPETQAVVVYLERPPGAIHLSDPATCL